MKKLMVISFLLICITIECSFEKKKGRENDIIHAGLQATADGYSDIAQYLLLKGMTYKKFEDHEMFQKLVTAVLDARQDEEARLVEEFTKDLK